MHCTTFWTPHYSYGCWKSIIQPYYTLGMSSQATDCTQCQPLTVSDTETTARQTVLCGPHYRMWSICDFLCFCTKHNHFTTYCTEMTPYQTGSSFHPPKWEFSWSIKQFISGVLPHATNDSYRYRMHWNQVADSSPGWAPLHSGLGQATYSCVPLSPSSIIWYQPRGWCLWLGK